MSHSNLAELGTEMTGLAVPNEGALPRSTPTLKTNDATLSGIKIACFYPWLPFVPSGSWTLFQCLWRYFVHEGATVTLPFLQVGKDTELQGVSARYLGEYTVFLGGGGRTLRQLVDNAQLQELRKYSQTEVDFLLRYKPELYHVCAKLRAFLDAIVSENDIVMCEYPLYAPLLSEFCKKWKRPLIVRSHDMLFELHGRHPQAKARLKEAELEAMGLADALLYVNDHERAQFERLGLSSGPTLTAGDTLAVTLGAEEVSRENVRSGLKMKQSRYCLFVGSSHGPNVDAVGEIRKLAKQMPDLGFVVAGTCATAVVDNNFVALGQVSDLMLGLLYRGAFAVVVPLLHGTGTSVKTFQAATYGKAIVTTALGLRGLGLVRDRDLLVVDGPGEIPAALRRLMADGALRETLAQNARAYAVRLDFRTALRPAGDIVRRLLQRPPTSVARESSALILADNNLSDRVGHHFNYALSIRDECLARGARFHALVNRKSSGEILNQLSGAGSFSAGIHEGWGANPYPPEWGNLRGTYDILVSNDDFARELAAGLAGKSRPGDVVFLPNATPRQILGLATLLHNQPLLRLLRYVVLLRYSTYVSSGPIADRKVVVDQDAATWYRLSLERLTSVDQFGAVRYVTDSAELAKEFEPMAKRAFEVLPIPHTTHGPVEVNAPDLTAKPAGVARVVFLGDARDEKGFELLPAVVRACGANPIGAKVEFVFQAYVSSHYHVSMLRVIDELDAMKRSNLHLIKRSMTADEYQSVLSSADLVLVPYDCGTYRARTSGPFVEGICANKPVVVPRNSWMSIQLGNSNAGITFTSGNIQDLSRAVVTLLGNLPVHAKAAAELGAKFREFHNPTRFVDRLLEGMVNTARDSGDGAGPQS